MTSFKEVLKRLKEEQERLGYSMREISEIEEEIKKKRYEWTRRFDEYITIILTHHENLKPKRIIEICEELADEREALLDFKFENQTIQGD